MKLVKSHLLIHFVDCIWMYGSALKFNGSMGESHLRNKTNQPGCITLTWNIKLLSKDYESEMEMLNESQQKLAAVKPVWLGCWYNVFSNEQGVS